MKSLAKKPVNVLLLSTFVLILLRTAWIGDDAYITMRTVDNLLSGYGPTWNVGERVQTFTHPLWMFLLTLAYGISHDAYLSLIGLSFLFSTLTIFILLVHGSENNYSVLIGWLILMLSNAFVDYSTAGLENPVSHLIALLFTLLYLRWGDQLSHKRMLTLALLAGLMILNRIDLFLLFLPALMEVVVAKDTFHRFRIILIGFLPFFIWEVFSIIYYGFPFPNTYYAKLNTGIQESALIRQGFLYFFNSIAWDPITLLVTGVSITLSMLSEGRKEKMIALGMLLYLGYIVWIGGDFMSSRFFSVPLLCGVLLLLAFLNKITFFHKTAFLAVIIFVGSMSFSPSYSAPTSRDDELENLTGISDEQAYYYPSTGLLRWGRTTSLPNQQWVNEGRALRDQAVRVYVGTGIGFLGFNAGSKVHVIDKFALSDPLLSHLPVKSKTKFLIGHFARAIPIGYIKTLETGENHIADFGIAEYYEKLSLITRGKIWSVERFLTIWKLNTGQYDYLLAP